MKAGLLLDFGQSDGAEQTPQATAVVELEFPSLDPSEKGPANGLDHILSTDTPLQCLWQVLLGHPLQGLVVLVTELADDLLIVASQASDQLLPFRIRSGHGDCSEYAMRIAFNLGPKPVVFPGSALRPSVQLFL